jgi:hypothetical protein
LKDRKRTYPSSPYTVSRSAAKALVKIGKPAVKPLIETLKDKDNPVRRAVIEALGEIGDKKAIKPLIEALKDNDRYVRRSAAKVLKKVTKKDFGRMVIMQVCAPYASTFFYQGCTRIFLAIISAMPTRFQSLLEHRPSKIARIFFANP